MNACTGSSLRVGWDLQSYDFVVKAGSSGAYRMVAEVLQSDGSPLPDYSGWEGTLAFFTSPDGDAAFEKTLTVTGDAGAHTLTFDLIFDPEDTAEHGDSRLYGSVWLSHPPDEGEWCPARINLKVERHD